MTKKIETISKFYSNDGALRRAIVLEVDNEYMVDLYEGNRLLRAIDCSGKSLRWAEDLAENFCEYVIQEEFE
jgi:hypothetical protein